LKSAFVFLFAGAAVLAASVAEAQVATPVAQPVIRVKAKLTAFDGQVMSLEPLKDQVVPGQKAGESLIVSVLPGTRYVGSDKASFGTIKRGDYAGAAVAEGRGGNLKAQDVYLYAEALRGSGEGRFPEGGRLIVNGIVSAAQSTGSDDKQGGNLILHYRGALLSGLGRGRTLCEGRASPPAYASALACEGDATIGVPPGTPVSALTVGDKSLLVPGSLVTVAMTKGADDKNVTPGVIVEKSVTVEKPQSPP
jgi:hypothetical protein